MSTLSNHNITYTFLKKSYLLSLLLIFCLNTSSSQSLLNHKVYLICNVSELEPTSRYFQQLIYKLNKEEQPTSLLVLGDMSLKNKRNGDPIWNTPLLQAFNQIKNKKVKIHFLSGDKDWDNSGKDGWVHVQLLEKHLKKEVKAKHSFSPDDGCPGPNLIKVSDALAIITINSQWFMHPHERPELTDSNCDILFEPEFWEELDGLIEDNEDKNVIIAAHHPIYSNGHYSGKIADIRSLIPFFGGAYLSYRRNDGTPRDMANAKYQHFITNMQRVLEEHHGVVYVSGHEFHTEILQKKENYYINSGVNYKSNNVITSKESLFSTSRPSITSLNYFGNGEVTVQVIADNRKTLFEETLLCSHCQENAHEKCKIVNHRYIPCEEVEQYPADDSFIKSIDNQTVTVITGAQYKASKFKTKMMGQHYRNEWTTPVELPYLDIGSIEGGMTPYAKGGGKQTDALKFILDDGRQYGFRSVNKNTSRDESFILNNSIATDFSQDLISNQLPFGDVVTSILLDHTDILHTRPRAYIMPDDPRLGPFRKEFAGVVGTLEERPKSKKKNRPAFRGADKVTSSNSMYRYLFKNNKNTIDAQSVARALMFDIWVGDWDRHGGNWKWAGFKNNKHYTFKPIPKDRDHVFPIYEGWIAGTYEKVLPHAAEFNKEINSIYSFMFQGRHFTNFLNSKMTIQDWQEAADYLQATFNEEIIEEAYEMMPKEIRHFSKERIKATLLARLPELDKAVGLINERFNKTGLMIGSNKKEEFDIERMATGDVKIRMFDPRSKDHERELLFEKKFDKSLTKEIHLYGLGDNDEFYIRGNAPSSIPIRIIGGHGNDIIEDRSKVEGSKKTTFVYDTKKEDSIKQSEETTIKKPYHEPKFNIYDFEDPALLPLVAPTFATDEGLGLAGQIEKTWRGFNKPIYRDKFILIFKYIPKLNSIKFKPKYIYNDIFKDQNLRLKGRFAINDLSFNHLYNLGNDVDRDEELFEDNFYLIKNNNYAFSMGLEKLFFNKSKFRYAIGVEHHNIDVKGENSFLAENIDLREYAVGENSMVFLRTTLDIDLLDHTDMPFDGSRIEIENTVYRGVEGDFDTYGKFDASYIEYHTLQLGRPATFALKIGGSIKYGGTAPFYHMINLSNSRNLRAYFNNQYIGNSGTYFNSLLRYDLGTIGKGFLPFDIGLLGFYDSARVFFNENNFSIADWHHSFGGGFYISLLKGQYNFHCTLGRNEFRDPYFKIDLGFGLE